MKSRNPENSVSATKHIGVFLCCLFAFGAGIHCVSRVSSETPLQASATDRDGRLILATGYVDADLEAVYSLDQTTGLLSAGVLSRQGGRFQGLYRGNVNEDLAAVLQRKNAGAAFPGSPKYTLVTGELDAENRGGTAWKTAKSVVYVAEEHTGMVLVYTIPWEPTLHGADQNHRGNMELIAAEQFHAAYAEHATSFLNSR